MATMGRDLSCCANRPDIKNVISTLRTAPVVHTEGSFVDHLQSRVLPPIVASGSQDVELEVPLRAIDQGDVGGDFQIRL